MFAREPRITGILWKANSDFDSTRKGRALHLVEKSGDRCSAGNSQSKK